MVDLAGISWNQVYEQFTALHRMFGHSNSMALIALPA